MDALFDIVTDRQSQITILAFLAVAVTVITLVGPMLRKDPMQDRIKSVTEYRDRLREQQRQELGNTTEKKNIRNVQAKGMVQQVVALFNLLEVFDADSAAKQLVMAGRRGPGPVSAFMFARLVTPLVSGVLAFFYIYILQIVELNELIKPFVVGGITLLGFYLPAVYVANLVTRRQQEMKLAFPDALDLLLICVESGMSVELAFQKVSEEIGTACPALAEEFGLTTAELSYLPDRKSAYNNLAKRTGLESIKSVIMAVVQSEVYGTSLGSTLRMQATESRAQRMQEAEKKAAALPPKLTVPMILFFLPVLFVVILAPAAIVAMQSFSNNM